MAATTKTTAATWIAQKWTDIDVLAYEEMRHVPNITEFGMVAGLLNIPYHANVTTGTLAAGSGSGLSFTANTESSATFTPASIYAAVEIENQLTVRAVQDPRGVLKGSLQSAIAAAIDSACLQDIASLTTYIVGDGSLNISKAAILDAYQKLSAGAKQYFSPGNDSGTCMLHVSQVDDLLSISDITSAQVRGDSANPIVSGWVAKAFGINFYESGNVYATGGIAYNTLYIKRALGIGYNQKAQTKVQEYQLTDRVIVWSDLAHGIVRDQYAVQIKSPSI